MQRTTFIMITRLAKVDLEAFTGVEQVKELRQSCSSLLLSLIDFLTILKQTKSLIYSYIIKQLM